MDRKSVCPLVGTRRYAAVLRNLSVSQHAKVQVVSTGNRIHRQPVLPDAAHHNGLVRLLPKHPLAHETTSGPDRASFRSSSILAGGATASLGRRR
jgi:hypothetical protein